MKKYYENKSIVNITDLLEFSESISSLIDDDDFDKFVYRKISEKSKTEQAAETETSEP